MVSRICYRLVDNLICRTRDLRPQILEWESGSEIDFRSNANHLWHGSNNLIPEWPVDSIVPFALDFFSETSVDKYQRQPPFLKVARITQIFWKLSVFDPCLQTIINVVDVGTLFE